MLAPWRVPELARIATQIPHRNPEQITTGRPTVEKLVAVKRAAQTSLESPTCQVSRLRMNGDDGWLSSAHERRTQIRRGSP